MSEESGSLGRAFGAAVPAVRRLRGERDALAAENARLQAQVAQLEQRVERQRVHKRDLRRRYDEAAGLLHSHSFDESALSYLFVATYGRSGSTLLQGILNSIPGYLVRGENSGALLKLHAFHQELASAAERNGPAVATTNSWYGIGRYKRETATALLRNLMLAGLLTPAPDTRVVGFKEIRWWTEEWRSLTDFVLEVFPGARFLINLRDHESVMKSKWWAEMEPQAARATLLDHEAQLSAMADHLGERAFTVRYDEYVGDPDALRPMFEWLGEPFDRAAIDAVLATPHSY